MGSNFCKCEEKAPEYNEYRMNNDFSGLNPVDKPLEPKTISEKKSVLSSPEAIPEIIESNIFENNEAQLEKCGKSRANPAPEINWSQGLAYEKLRLSLGKYLNKDNYGNAKAILRQYCAKHNIKFDEKLIMGSKRNSKASIPELHYHYKDNQLKLENILHPSQMRSTDPNTALVLGELWKYHPGFTQSFFKKYCILTKGGFQYHRTKWTANCSADFPLTYIPLENIRSVQRVHVKIPEKQATSLFCKKPAIDFTKCQFEIFTKRSVTSAEISNFMSPISANAKSRGEERSIDTLHVPTGHLMKPPFRLNLQRTPVKNQAEKYDRRYYEWTQRELSWYEAETKFLFVAENELEVEKWLTVFKWLLRQVQYN